MYISLNQEFIKEEDARFAVMPWQLQTQGGILNEDIRANAAKPLLAEPHFKILAQNARLLNFDLPTYLDEHFLSTQIAGLLTRNKLFQAANVRVTLMRNAATNQTDVVISSQMAGDGPYELNRKGLFIDVFDEAYVTVHSPYQLNQFCQLVNGMAKAAAVPIAAALWCRQDAPELIEYMTSRCDFAFHTAKELYNFLFNR